MRKHNEICDLLSFGGYLTDGNLHFIPGKYEEGIDVDGYHVELKDYFYVGNSRPFRDGGLGIGHIPYGFLNNMKTITEDEYYCKLAEVIYNEAAKQLGADDGSFYILKFKPTKERKKIMNHITEQMRTQLGKLVHGR